MTDPDPPTERLVYLQPRQEPDMTEPVVAEPQPTADVPEPVRAAAGVWGSVVGIIGLVVSGLATFGALSVTQAAAITAITNYVSAYIVPVGSALAGLFTLVGALVGAHVTAAVGRRKVQPVPAHPLETRR